MSDTDDQCSFFWQNGVITDLNAPRGTGKQSCAGSINNLGHAAGFFGDRSVKHACLWQYNQIIDLGTLGGTYGAARAINDHDQVVGCSSTADGVAHAFLYDNGGMIDLNTWLPPASGWVLTGANDINNSGWIVGQGTLNGQTHAFLLTPEPASLALLAGGFALIIRRSRR